MRTIIAGDVYMTTFEQNGHVQSGYRPAAVISNNVGNKFSPNVIVVPLTTADKNPYQPTHVLLSAAENGLREDSIALCENPMTIPKDALQGYCTHLTGDALNRIRVGMIASMALLSGLDLPTVNRAAEMSSRLSNVS